MFVSVADKIIALLMIVFLLPIILVVAFLIYLSDGTPIIYKHERVGKNGNLFTLFKFRTMKKRSSEIFEEMMKDEIVYQEWITKNKIINDKRIIKYGSFLRKYSLDELPQLYNVIVGNMNLVGPRPVTKEEYLNKYRNRRNKCFSIKPGISGLWQISGRNKTTYNKRIALDYIYSVNHTICWHYYLLIKTPYMLFIHKGR